MDMANVDVDLFNKEQRPLNYEYDCLEYWQYLYESWKIDTSDEEYERRRDMKAEKECLYECEYEQW